MPTWNHSMLHKIFPDKEIILQKQKTFTHSGNSK